MTFAVAPNEAAALAQRFTDDLVALYHKATTGGGDGAAPPALDGAAGAGPSSSAAVAGPRGEAAVATSKQEQDGQCPTCDMMWSDGGGWIECGTCSTWYCFPCAHMTAAKARKVKWACPKCTKRDSWDCKVEKWRFKGGGKRPHGLKNLELLVRWVGCDGRPDETAWIPHDLLVTPLSPKSVAAIEKGGVEGFF